MYNEYLAYVTDRTKIRTLREKQPSLLFVFAWGRIVFKM